MTDFVLEQYKNNYHANTPTRILNYANFLKQPLELWMFVPCDEDGNVLKFNYPQNKVFDDIAQIQFEKQYQQAKERCLFDVECIDISNGVFKGLKFGSIEYNITTKIFFYGCKIVEDIIEYNLQLTQTAIKQIGL